MTDISPAEPDSTPATVTVDLAGPAHGGSVLGRLGEDAGDRAGQVVFVRGALPGETGARVLLDPGTGKKRYLTGRVEGPDAVAGPSPHRTGPACPAAAAGAGCCDLDYVDQEGSAAWKHDVVVDQFTRIGHVDLTAVPVTTRSLRPFTGYRTRVRLGVDSEGRAGLRISGSHSTVPVERAVCAQWAPGLADGLAEELGGLTLTPGAEVCVAVGDDGRRSAVELTKPAAKRRTTRGRRDRRPSAPHRRIVRRVLTGPGTVTHTVNAVTWTVPVEAFWQAHLQAPAFYSDWITATLSAAAPDVPEQATAWDLYGGAGVFAAALTEALLGAQVACVDVASSATTAGRDALEGRPVSFIAGDVAASFGKLDTLTGTEPRKPFAVVLDPPRTGAGRKILTEVTTRAPEHILHIGCDPATAARDAADLCAAGYRPESVVVADAFGLTHHVEVLVHYVRDVAPGDR